MRLSRNVRKMLYVCWDLRKKSNDLETFRAGFCVHKCTFLSLSNHTNALVCFGNDKIVSLIMFALCVGVFYA